MKLFIALFLCSSVSFSQDYLKLIDVSVTHFPTDIEEINLDHTTHYEVYTYVSEDTITMKSIFNGYLPLTMYPGDTLILHAEYFFSDVAEMIEACTDPGPWINSNFQLFNKGPKYEIWVDTQASWHLALQYIYKEQEFQAEIRIPQ